ncbi:F-box domain-containing protein [Strongyloides ratti]|uniref:F-box domain-containing protein n=1 Tax=Strongyloides ratti TaxID=34506 RepID=A0A090KXU1_STRRB|nr:F-box domain-containing protein [Strongyloides ratti]CEF62206.1 F-box domain-containing protein [Strongyloides ratti]
MSSNNIISNFSITSLPSEVIKIILQNTDWKTIYNMRLVSKFFNSLILTNFESLPKPLMTGLSISSTTKLDGTMYIEFFYLYENEYIKVEDIYIPNQNSEPKVMKIESFLKKMNLKYIVNFEIIVTGETIIFDILNKYFKDETIIDSLQINIQKSSCFKSFSIFIQKIKYVTYLWLNKLCFLNQSIPLNYTLPMIECLNNLCLVECECTKFVNSKMIMNLYRNNKNLKRILVFSNCTDFEVKLIQCIGERQSSCDGTKNCHGNCYIYLPLRNDMIFGSRMENYFPPNMYDISYPLEIDNTIIGVKECSKCLVNCGIALCLQIPTYLSDTNCNFIFDRTLFIDDNFYID